MRNDHTFPIRPGAAECDEIDFLYISSIEYGRLVSRRISGENEGFKSKAIGRLFGSPCDYWVLVTLSIYRWMV